jgi:hypothetical protein
MWCILPGKIGSGQVSMSFFASRRMTCACAVPCSLLILVGKTHHRVPTKTFKEADTCIVYLLSCHACCSSDALFSCWLPAHHKHLPRPLRLLFSPLTSSLLRRSQRLLLRLYRCSIKPTGRMDSRAGAALLVGALLRGNFRSTALQKPPLRCRIDQLHRITR